MLCICIVLFLSKHKTAYGMRIREWSANVVSSDLLLAMKRQCAVIQAIVIRDTGEAVTRFLERHGDPFARIGFDPESRVQMAFGSGGVPETFVVDGKGVIRYQHIGEIRPEHVPMLIAELEKAR